MLVDVGTKPPSIVATGMYTDTLVKTASGWRFKTRQTEDGCTAGRRGAERSPQAIEGRSQVKPDPGKLMLNVWLLKFAEWIGATSFSVDLHESYYMYAWIESIHVITLMISLGMLIIIDLRMLGVALTNVPASKLAERLDRPMLIGFSHHGHHRRAALHARSRSARRRACWFRIKVILLIVAFINAWLFRHHMKHSGRMGSRAEPPRRTAARPFARALVRRGHQRTLHRLRLVRLPSGQPAFHRLGGGLRRRSGAGNTR